MALRWLTSGTQVPPAFWPSSCYSLPPLLCSPACSRLQTCCTVLKNPATDPTCPQPAPPTPPPSPPAVNITCFNMTALLDGLAIIQSDTIASLNANSNPAQVGWRREGQLASKAVQGAPAATAGRSGVLRLPRLLPATPMRLTSARCQLPATRSCEASPRLASSRCTTSFAMPPRL